MLKKILGLLGVIVLCCMSTQVFARGLFFKGDLFYSTPLNHGVITSGQTIRNEYFHQRASGFTTASAFGLGIGYQLNSSLGLDVTYSYYLSKDINFDRRRVADGAISLFHTGLKSKVVTVNATWDLYRIGINYYLALSPFLTGGLGYAHNKLNALMNNDVRIAGQRISVGNGLVWDAGVGMRLDLLGGLSGSVMYRVTRTGATGVIKQGNEVLLKPRSPINGELVLGLKYFI